MAEAKKKLTPKVKENAEPVAEVMPAKAAPETKIKNEETSEKTLAKAGKRSAKAMAAAEEKEAKQERKQASDTKTTSSDKPKIAQKPPKSRQERAGKKYRETAKQLEPGKSYSLAEAVELAAKTATTTFASTIEMHFNLSVDPKQADQNVRGMVSLPNGSGKTARVAVFAEGDDIARAKKAGAEIAGADEILAALDKEQIEFDILIATPTLMARLGKYAKMLGPKGLMPNPKSGTVTADVAKAVAEAKAGRVEYRVDQAGIIHLGIGKVSFGPKKLLDNAQAVADSVRAAKPASVKGTYIKSLYLTSSMGPSVKTEL